MRNSITFKEKVNKIKDSLIGCLILFCEVIYMFYTKRLKKAYQQGYRDAMNQCNMQFDMQNYMKQQKDYNKRVRLSNIAKLVLCIPVSIIVGLCFDKYFGSTLFHDNPVCYLVLYIFMVT